MGGYAGRDGGGGSGGGRGRGGGGRGRGRRRYEDEGGQEDGGEYGDPGADRGPEIQFTFSETRMGTVLTVGREHIGSHASVFVGGQFVDSPKITHKGQLKFPRHSPQGRRFAEMLTSPGDIRVYLRAS